VKTISREDPAEEAAPAATESFEAHLQTCALEGGELPGEVLIAPWGEVASANGSFVIDADSAALVLSAFQAHGTDVPIDYEHQSLGGSYASPSGLAPAAGWIRELRAVTPDEGSEGKPTPGLWAQVNWTQSGRDRIAAREYRYLSPVVMVRRSDRRVVALHSAALTNKPAIVGMRPIVNREPVHIESAEPVTHIQIEADEKEPATSAGWERLRRELGVSQEESEEEVLVAASERLAGLTREQAQTAAVQRVAQAARDGKLPGSLREWAMRLAMRDPACFEEWVRAAPVVVIAGRTAKPDAPRDDRDHAAVATAARASYRAEPALANLTSEDAFVADAVRQFKAEN
jgi:phage I-like protein